MARTPENQTSSSGIEILKAVMPTVAILVAAISGFVLVDRHSQNLADRQQNLKEIEFESSNVFRILEKYLENQPYPEIARYQMLEFISETTHNEKLKDWASLQQTTNFPSIDELNNLAREISRKRLQLETRKYDTERRLQEQSIEREEEKIRRSSDLSKKIDNLRKKLKTDREILSKATVEISTADDRRGKAKAEYELAQERLERSFTPDAELRRTAQSELENRRAEYQAAENSFQAARSKYEQARSDVKQTETELEYAETDLARLGAS